MAAPLLADVSEIGLVLLWFWGRGTEVQSHEILYGTNSCRNTRRALRSGAPFYGSLPGRGLGERVVMYRVAVLAGTASAVVAGFNLPCFTLNCASRHWTDD